MSTYEVWRPIPGYTGYEVSTLGRVRGRDRMVRARPGYERFVKGTVHVGAVDGNGYRQVNLAGKTVRVHLLVLLAFSGPRPDGLEACHNNGDPLDNRLANLRWDTRLENMRDVVRHGRRVEMNRTHCPRGHVLAEPNLVPFQLRRGRRSCLACDRARLRVQTARRRGRVLLLKKAHLADGYYQRFMKAAS